LDVSRTVFEILPLKFRKILVLPTPTWFDVLAKGDLAKVTPFEFFDEMWHMKTTIVGLPVFLRFDTIPAVTDGRTNGRTRCSRKDPR